MPVIVIAKSGVNFNTKTVQSNLDTIVVSDLAFKIRETLIRGASGIINGHDLQSKLGCTVAEFEEAVQELLDKDAAYMDNLGRCLMR